MFRGHFDNLFTLPPLTRGARAIRLLRLLVVPLFASAGITGCAGQDGSELALAVPIFNKPDFYPGLEEGIKNSQLAEYKKWFETYRPQIVEIGRTIGSIRNGATKSGCIESTLFNCIATMAQSLPIASGFEFGRDNLFLEPAPDVNGHTSGKQADVSGYSPIWYKKYQSVYKTRVHYSISVKNGLVGGLDAVLISSPITSRTEKDYSETGLYQAVALPLRGECPNLTPTEVYQWFENSMKPNITKKRDIDVSPGSSSMTDTYSAKGMLCGRHVDFTDFDSESTNMISEYNRDGTSYNSFVFIYK